MKIKIYRLENGNPCSNGIDLGSIKFDQHGRGYIEVQKSGDAKRVVGGGDYLVRPFGCRLTIETKVGTEQMIHFLGARFDPPRKPDE